MIENDKQYRVTQSQAKKFEEALVQLEQNLDSNQEIHPLLLKAQKEALESQLDELREELLEYETLKSASLTKIIREGLLEYKALKSASLTKIRRKRPLIFNTLSFLITLMLTASVKLIELLLLLDFLLPENENRE